jgi:hypothetical protein
MKKNTISNVFLKETEELKLEFVKWCLTFFASVGIILIVLGLIDAFYNPDLQEHFDLAKQMLVVPETVLPEPKEKMKFIAALFFGTISLFVCYYFLDKLLNEKKIISLHKVYGLLLTFFSFGVLFILYKGLTSDNPFSETPQNSHDIVAKNNADFYFVKTFIHKYFYIFLVVIFPLLTIYFLDYFNLKKSISAKIEKLFNYISIGFSMSLILIVIGISTFHFPYTFENKYDFNAVYYSVVQVYNGFPMLVDNFTNTYGLYPHFILPILKLFGLSIFNFTLIMGILLSICFSSMYYFLYKNISNKLIVLFGFTSVFYNSYLYFRLIVNFDSAFATSPIRWLFPCILLAYSVVFFSKIKESPNFKKEIPYLNQFGISIIKLVSFLFFALGLLWAPDTGLFTYLALISFYSYQEIDIKNIKFTFIKIIIHILIALLSAAIIICLYVLFIKLTYGNYPDIASVYLTIKSFSILGLGMLPIPNTWHIWMIVAIVYFIGILYSIVAIYNGRINQKSTSVFLLSVLGVLFFSYYQGRSHNWNLLIINFPVFMLLAIFCDDLLKLFQQSKHLLSLFIISLFLISFSFFQILYDKNNIIDLVTSKKDKKLYYSEQQKIMTTSKIIDDLSSEKEKVFILSAVQYQSLYHNFSNTASAFNPGFVELFTNKHYNDILARLQKDSVKVFLEPQLFRFSNSKIFSVLSSVYDVQKEFVLDDTNTLLWYLTKKQKKIKSDPLLAGANNIVLHKVLNTDFAAKVNYSMGISEPIKLDTNFTVEIIFKPSALNLNPYNESATLLSNLDGDEGFALMQNMKNPNQYIFTYGNQGILSPVIPNTWNYLVFEVKKNKIRCYANGVFVGSITTERIFKNSDKSLFVGNFNNSCCYFFGDIYELLITNEQVDEEKIVQDFKNISSKLQ